MVHTPSEIKNDKKEYGLLKNEPCLKAKNRRSSIQADLQKSSKQLLDLLKEIRDEEQQRQEQEEIKKIREQMEFKANPIRHYRQLTIHPSNIPPTIPQSPQLHTEQRIRARSLHHSFKLCNQ
ncbi:unnamed protein product [Brachionus calyciflorus]|uniref:TPX2 C-terminal domain-containing protein n=1 Tax=Brachionus calyciflorus TaxID=104777 RepID=A0A813WJS2_9BILA|nr:unnamed protein product [Brachionus calyciflorus]